MKTKRLFRSVPFRSVLFRSVLSVPQKNARQVWRKRLFFFRLVHTGVALYVVRASCSFELVFCCGTESAAQTEQSYPGPTCGCRRGRGSCISAIWESAHLYSSTRRLQVRSNHLVLTMVAKTMPFRTNICFSGVGGWETLSDLLQNDCWGGLERWRDVQHKDK